MTCVLHHEVGCLGVCQSGAGAVARRSAGVASDLGGVEAAVGGAEARHLRI